MMSSTVLICFAVALLFAAVAISCGRLMTADLADPEAFIAKLESAFDMKNEKVCGIKD